jgi:hypothetical protein
MANVAEINAVKLQIPDEAASLGFDDAAIGNLLDSGLSSVKTILTILRGMSAKASSFEDVSEAGSSRSSRFFDNLRQLIDVWQKLADKEDAATGVNKEKEGLKFHTITRV